MKRTSFQVSAQGRERGLFPAPRLWRDWIAAPILAGFCAWADVCAAASVQSKIVWPGGSPQLEVMVSNVVASGAAPMTNRTLWIGVRAVNEKGDPVDGFTGGQALNLNPDGKPAISTFPLVAGKSALPSHDYFRVTARDALLGVSYDELVYAQKPGDLLQSYSVRIAGDMTNRTARLALHFARAAAAAPKTLELELRVLDGESNQLENRTRPIVLSETGLTDVEIDVTPKRETAGPYSLSFGLNHEESGLALAFEARFPFATVLAPITSMESDTLADWHIPGTTAVSGSANSYLIPKGALDRRNLPASLFSFYQPFGRPVFDSDVRRSGTRSLRIDYSPSSAVVIGSNLRLPGLPVVARIWVKGNNTRDRLTLEWRDPCNFNAAAHQRFMNTLAVEICRLDFTDWKCLTVPIMGDGLLGRDTMAYMVGSAGLSVKHPIQTPLYLAALRVIPEPPPKGAEPATETRSVWIDDILVETQVPRSERLSLELRGDTPERTLRPGAQLLVSVGNGTGNDIRGGRISVTFLDADGETVHELFDTFDAPAGEFTGKALALDPVEAIKPRGPITAIVTVTGPVPGQRVQSRLVFSRPTGGGLFWDFERGEHFNPQGPDLGSGADPVAGGANGTGHALPLAVTTNRPIAVMLHPAMPGIVESVEMQVFGTGTPVILQPVFVDSGSRDFDITYNQFAAPPIRVDWQGWKSCRFSAPPIPQNFTTGEGNPFYSPLYPLNLALRAHTEDGAPATIRIDQIQVSTHLDPKRELFVETDYPDETLLHVADGPLRLVFGNYSAGALPLDIRFRLTTAAGTVAEEGIRKLTLAAGARLSVTLVDKLREGFYHLRVEGLPGGRVFDEDIQTPDRKRYFGDTIMSRLTDIRGLLADLGLAEKRINLDWDTTEPVPNLFYYNWFRRFAARASETGSYAVIPIVGYSTDWAGPEKQEALAGGWYTRDTGNYMQVPVRVADWNMFVRAIARQHAKDFNTWVFWQSPDMKESPVYLPPDKYTNMFNTFSEWISLCNTGACIVAGGFSFDRVLNYLEGMQAPQALPFDLFEVRVNPGGATLEDIQLEDFLEDLDAKLQLKATGRKAAIIDMDWPTGDTLSLLDQASYHARAAVMLHASGVLPHKFLIANNDQNRDGFGVLFRTRFGNSFTQPPRSFFVPKPAYFVLMESRKMLADLEYLQRVAVADRDPQANRAYVFRQKGGGICVVVWRVHGSRAYRIPAEWSAVQATDAFGSAVSLDKNLLLGGMPLFLRFTAVTPVEQITHALRNLQPLEVDGQYKQVLDFFPAGAYARQAAEYTAIGGEKAQPVVGRVFGGERLPPEGFLQNVSEERFAFRLNEPADVLLSRLWLLGADKRTLRVSLNGGPEQVWNLAPSAGLAASTFDTVYVPGPRRSALVLRGCRSGRNEVVLRHDGPVASGGFRVTAVTGGRVDLSDCGPLAVMDSGVAVQTFRNAWGGPLKLGKQTYASGIGCMGITALEFPLNKQFTRFEVTVGIDAVTAGKGSVSFRILVDGKERAKSGATSGMTMPKTLSVDDLDGAERLLLMVDDGGDGSDNDLANWVNPVLVVKEVQR
jgi:hypothetical protein